VRESNAVPSGTVTFLFTDIEGSTGRWDANRDAMQAALRRHDAIVRAAIERHDGVVFKTVGDAFCAAFSETANALRAAVDAQRALAQEDWAAVNGLRVRMAIHVGESDERDGDYFGPAVNRVARLLAAGHGGQVLVSGLAADAASATLPAGVGLRRLGTLPLRGLKEPERVFQLTAPNLASEFKPLRALETPPNNLPRQSSSFIGRSHDLAEVENLLRANALVTVVGTGGVGKTRLALAAAAELLGDTPEGAWFVDLAPISDAALVPSAILTALGADQTADAPALDLLVGNLQKRGLLLVPDNCEHLIGEVARVVATVLRNCPQVTILATSREALNVSGEHVHRLSSLGDDEAVKLFADRATAVNPSFRLDETNRAQILDLCRRLDGIALAIELAAARTRSVSLDELSRRLHFLSLGGGRRDLQPRQQTMHALIDWSYNLLSPPEQRLFRGLSVFAGGFTLEAATGVSGVDVRDEEAVLDLLTSLLDKSLLAADVTRTHQRYRLLESIREYACERRDAEGETSELRRRHAQIFSAVAERAYAEWDTAPGPDWLAQHEKELDNFRVALHWAFDDENDVDLGARIAADVAPLFLRLSLLREGIGWCERALAFATSLRPGVGARLYYGLSMLLHNQGANERALASAQRAVELYRAAGAERGLARALSQVAHHLADRDAYDDARTAAEESLARARGLHDPRLLASTLQRCAFIYKPEDIELARSRFSESVALFRSLGRADETARALAWWSDAEGIAGNLRAAVDIARDALDIASDDTKLYLLNGLASCYLALGERAHALQAAREAFGLAVKAGHPVATPCAMLYLAALESDANAVHAARLSGYAQARLQALDWKLVGPDRAIEARLQATLQRNLAPEELRSLRAAGAAWNEQEAIANAARV
jgi:predicted ATPase/class 3 adenylate cyclase